MLFQNSRGPLCDVFSRVIRVVLVWLPPEAGALAVFWFTCRSLLSETGKWKDIRFLSESYPVVVRVLLGVRVRPIGFAFFLVIILFSLLMSAIVLHSFTKFFQFSIFAFFMCRW